MSLSDHPIGIFDFGVGGLSVLRAVHELTPAENIVYFGDQGHVPYGPRPMGEIQKFSEGITRFLLEHNSKLIVGACNTASAAALKYLRERFPEVSFVGMEPAVKPAAELLRPARWVSGHPGNVSGCVIRICRGAVRGGCGPVPKHLPRVGFPD